MTTAIITADTEDDSRKAPVSKSEVARASSAHSRINIPFNLNNWKALPQETQDELAWFHQHALEEGLNWKQCTEALGYSQTVIWRSLKGEYNDGKYEPIIDAIRSYRKIISERLTIKNAAFRETPITRLVTGALSYAMANNSMTVITGESRQGKTASALWWRDENNHGRTVFMTAPAYGSCRALLKEIAASLGINRNTGLTNMHESILRAFNSNRMLIVDEAHRLLPKDARTDPVMLEILRDIHDRTGCGLALLTTARFGEGIKRSTYMYEQVLGRIGMPVQLPREMTWECIEPIVSQYLKAVPADLRKELIAISNAHGRLGILCETLKFANRIALKSQRKLDADVVKTAIATRRQMMGETQYAKK
jgi:DNA transposition AAA+ family ATPase